MTTETINMRADSERKQRLQLAADLSHVSLTAFVLSAADERAIEIIAAARSTELPGEFFDGFFEAIASQPRRSLTDAVTTMRRRVRRDD